MTGISTFQLEWNILRFGESLLLVRIQICRTLKNCMSKLTVHTKICEIIFHQSWGGGGGLTRLFPLNAAAAIAIF